MQYCIKLNDINDKDIIDQLDKQKNIIDYIRTLIKRDLQDAKVNSSKSDLILSKVNSLEQTVESIDKLLNRLLDRTE